MQETIVTHSRAESLLIIVGKTNIHSLGARPDASSLVSYMRTCVKTPVPDGSSRHISYAILHFLPMVAYGVEACLEAHVQYPCRPAFFGVQATSRARDA